MEKENKPRVSLIDRFEALFVERCICTSEEPNTFRDHLIGCPLGEEIHELPIVIYCRFCNKTGTAPICRFCWSTLKGEIVDRSNLETKRGRLQIKQHNLDAAMTKLTAKNRKLDGQYGKSKYSLF